jgi:eukaryotic-like serine/threonine-protein kinase
MSSALQSGSIFAGRFQVLSRVGTGGSGAIYDVLSLEDGNRYALKIMLAHVAWNGDLRERFLREARVAAQIERMYVVDVFDAGVDDETGMPFLVMELLEGEELGRRVQRVGPLPPHEALTYLGQAAIALEKTHDAGIVHRDLKPENLFLVTREGEPPHVKILDFGVAKILDEGVAESTLTAMVGTPIYMSPEQFRKGKVGRTADIFSLGMIAYTLLVGDAYWGEELRKSVSAFSLTLSAAHGPVEPPSPRAARQGVLLPPGFDAWFAQATAPNPAQRFPSARAAFAALAALYAAPEALAAHTAAARASHAYPEAAAPGAARGMARHPTSARRSLTSLVGIALGTAMGIVFAGFAVLAFLEPRGRPAPLASVSASAAARAATQPSASSPASSSVTQGGSATVRPASPRRTPGRPRE